MVEPLPKLAHLGVEVRVEGELPLDEQRRDEDDPGSALGGEAAGEVERVLRLLPAEQRHDDAPEAGRGSAPDEPADTALQCLEIGPPHRSSW